MAMTLRTRNASSLALLWSRLKDLRAWRAGRTTEQSLRWHFVKWQRFLQIANRDSFSKGAEGHQLTTWKRFA